MATLQSLAADIRQWPMDTPEDVEHIDIMIGRMGTDCGYIPTSHEVVEYQRSAREWMMARVLGKVAERTMKPWRLAQLARAVLDSTRPMREPTENRL